MQLVYTGMLYVHGTVLTGPRGALHHHAFDRPSHTLLYCNTTMAEHQLPLHDCDTSRFGFRVVHGFAPPHGGRRGSAV